MGTALGPTALRWGHRGDPWLWEGDRAASGSAALTQQTCSTQQVTGERQHSFRRGESEVSPYPKPVRKAPQELLQQHRAAGRVELGAPQAFVSESSSCGCRVQLAGMSQVVPTAQQQWGQCCVLHSAPCPAPNSESSARPSRVWWASHCSWSVWFGFPPLPAAVWDLPPFICAWSGILHIYSKTPNFHPAQGFCSTVCTPEAQPCAPCSHTDPKCPPPPPHHPWGHQPAPPPTPGPHHHHHHHLQWVQGSPRGICPHAEGSTEAPQASLPIAKCYSPSLLQQPDRRTHGICSPLGWRDIPGEGRPWRFVSLIQSLQHQEHLNSKTQHPAPSTPRPPAWRKAHRETITRAPTHGGRAANMQERDKPTAALRMPVVLGLGSLTH